jgi:large conductance mechanosensitive channel
MLAFGNFLTIVMNFVILAFVIFLMVKQVNRIKKDTPVAPAPTPEDVLLLREILEALKK